MDDLMLGNASFDLLRDVNPQAGVVGVGVLTFWRAQIPHKRFLGIPGTNSHTTLESDRYSSTLV
jgi:hypothetical protein